MKNKFYITTPIYYVNASPHIGHSYTNIAADSLARYMRQTLGRENAWFLTGSDEHGQKIEKAAEQANLSPQEFVDKVVVQFKGLWDNLGISYNDFIRTTQARHINTLSRSLEILYEKGDIYLDKYVGWYCVPCETFWMESELAQNSCPDCKRPVEKINETNYFFKLKKYQNWLIEYIKDKRNINFILPVTRRNEVLGFLENNELTDLCISRPRQRLSWGVPLPFSPEHVTYVWFDALINYISAVGSFDEQGNYNSQWWQDEVEVVHLIGKDILRHHAVYWPIMLYALGIRQPDTIFAHGWWLINENKMSKSRGNVVNPLKLVDKYGADVYRYFLLRDMPFGYDGNFSEEAIIKRFNSELANDLGNLVYRSLTMLEKYCQGVVPEQGRLKGQGLKIQSEIKLLAGRLKDALNAGADFNFSLGLERIWELINMANKYVEETKPWALAKENRELELKSFIRLLVDLIRETAKEIAPFLPRTSELIFEQLGQERVKKGPPLFPRIETKTNK